MKYIDADRLKAEIERLKSQLIRGACAAQIEMETNCKDEAYNKVLAFLDSLQQEQMEEPDKDLEVTAGEYEKNHTYQRYDGGGLTPEYNATLAEAFIAGAEWQKEQMMKEAVEGFIFQSEDYYPKELIARYDGELKHGDKVRIIVLPKEDER